MKRYAIYWLCCISLCSTLAQADYLAYSVTGKDEKHPLPEAIDDIESEYLLNLEWGKFDGNKALVAIMDIENESKDHGLKVDGMEALLTDIMLRSNRFRMLERQVIDKAIKEQDLGASGRVTAESAAKLGQILGAQYLVQAVVTNYDPDYKGNNVGLGGLTSGFLGGLSIGNKASLVGMNFRLIDAASGEVLFSKQTTAVVEKSNFGLGGLGFGGGGILGGAFSSFEKTPIGNAVIAAMNKGVYELAKQTGTSTTRGTIIKVEGQQAFINLGQKAVKKGDKLKVISIGEALIDPDTGLNLGGEEITIGNIEVIDTKEKFSVAKLLSNSGTIKRGDKIESTTAPSALEFASDWALKKTNSKDTDTTPNNSK